MRLAPRRLTGVNSARVFSVYRGVNGVVLIRTASETRRSAALLC